MDIQGASHPVVLSAKSYPGATERGKRGEAAQAKPARQEPSPAPADDAASSPAQDGDSAGTRAQGVLRLLEAGHFRGVADVRLRINFFDELSAKATADAQQAAQTGAANLVSGVNDNLAGLTEALAADPDMGAGLGDLGKTFQDSVQNSLDAFVGAQTRDSAALADSLQSAFTTLVDGLRVALTPQDPVEVPADPATDGADQPPADTAPAEAASDGQAEVPADSAPAGTAEVPVDAASAGTGEADPGAAPVDAGTVATGPGPVEPLPEAQDPAPAEAPAFDVEGALTSLTAVFDGLLRSMMNSIDSRATLADPSSPSGNGKAYEKFLQVYNEMRGIPQDPTPPATDPLEVVG